MNHRRHVAAWSVLLVALAGCGGGNQEMPRTQATDQTTPAVTVLKMNRAALEGDREAYLACFVGSEEQLAVAEAMYDFAREGLAFREAMLGQYGQAGWAHVQQYFALPSTEMAGWQVRDESADEATLVQPLEQTALRLRRVDGQWYIRAGEFVPADESAERVVAWFGATTDEFARIRQRIGQPGVVPGDIRAELNRAFGSRRRGAHGS